MKEGKIKMTNLNQQVAEIAVQQHQTTLAQNVVVGSDGKFKRMAQYDAICTIKAVEKADKIRLVNIMNGADETVIPLKSHIKKKITVENVMTNPYDSVDEDTGEITNGVVTTLFDVDGSVYVTSSKSVYFTLNNIFKVFGLPNTEGYEPLEFLVYEEAKGNSRNKSIDLKLIG